MKNCHNADFELYANLGHANAQHLFKLFGIGYMPLHKYRNIVWCALSGQVGWVMCVCGGGGGHAVRWDPRQNWDNNPDRLM